MKQSEPFTWEFTLHCEQGPMDGFVGRVEGTHDPKPGTKVRYQGAMYRIREVLDDKVIATFSP